MRAVVAKQLGNLDVLELQDVPKPEAGNKDLIVEVHASSINPVDTKARSHGLGGILTPPLVLGFDFSGKVVGLGSAVKGFKVGDEVFGFASLFRNGAHAEYVAADYRLCAIKPSPLSHTDAASMPIAVLTAWEALYDRLQIENGSPILVHAGGGGVGHIALQLAKLRQCKVITTASSDQSRALCNQLGADLVINHKTENFVDRVLAETGQKGVRYVLDCVGGQVFERSLDCLEAGGAIATIVEGESSSVHQKLFFKNASAHFVFIGAAILNEIRPERQGEILAAAAKLVTEGKMHPHVSKIISLDQVAEGHALQETGRSVGKIAVKIK